ARHTATAERGTDRERGGRRRVLAIGPATARRPACAHRRCAGSRLDDRRPAGARSDDQGAGGGRRRRGGVCGVPAWAPGARSGEELGSIFAAPGAYARAGGDGDSFVRRGAERCRTGTCAASWSQLCRQFRLVTLARLALGKMGEDIACKEL